MSKTCNLLLLILTALLISACKAKPASLTPPPVLPTSNPEMTDMPSVESSTISGQFLLTNTSTLGMEVGIEAMNILLEYRNSPDDPWDKMEVSCTFEPPAPLVLNQELPVSYKCQYKDGLPTTAESHVIAEVKIFGKEDVYRLEVKYP